MFNFPPAVHPYSEGLNLDELQRSKAHVVFSHRGFPSNCSGVPVVWQNSILDPKMAISFGRSPASLEEETAAKRPLFGYSSVVQVSSDAERLRLKEVFPESADKFRTVPFFLPYLPPKADRGMLRKQTDHDLKILFVGREARRKGLPQLLSVLSMLGMKTLKGLQLTIVSNFSDGAVSIPEWRNIRVFKTLPSSEVARLMQQSHIFAMPSKFESFGFAFLEAMTYGAVVIAPDWEVQSELVDYGRAGLTVSSEAHLAKALDSLLGSRTERATLADEAMSRYDERYSPRVSAALYAAMFAEASLS